MSGIIGAGGGGSGGGTTPTTPKLSIQGMACASLIDNILLVQDLGLVLNVLNALGTNFETSTNILNSSGTPFSVSKNVKDADGNSFTVI